MLATLGTFVFNVFGIIGGFSSSFIAGKLGLRRASAIGFGAVFAMLVVLGIWSGTNAVAVLCEEPAARPST